MLFKRGFTLAEVLITLGIIGVVAALTIPVIIGNYKEKQTVVKLKSVYSTLSQAMLRAETEYGEITSWGISNNNTGTNIIANNLKPFLKIGLDCNTNDEKGQCIYLGKYKTLKGEELTYGDYTTQSNMYKIMLNNGISIWWRGGGNNDLIWFKVDINGPKPPNTIAKDFFEFSYKNGKLIPDGSDDSEIFNDCNKNDNGWDCTYYVLKNENMNYLK